MRTASITNAAPWRVLHANPQVSSRQVSLSLEQGIAGSFPSRTLPATPPTHPKVEEGETALIPLLRLSVPPAVQANQLEQELVKADKATERNRNQVAELEARNQRLQEENKQLEQSMKEILAALKEQAAQTGAGGSGGGGGDLQIPNLERLVAVRAGFSVGNTGATIH